MNYRMIAYLSGLIILIIGAFMALPALVALFYGESSGIWFLVTIAIAGLLGGILYRLKPKNTTMYAREGFFVTALSWINISILGAMPFFLSGQIPNFIDAVFEMVSGFTTTGASILTDVEALDHCMIFWRSFSHWLGGMGILVFMLAVVSIGGGETNYLLRAESPGPSVSKMVPNMRKTATILYSIYIVMTILQIVLLLIGGMPLFDSLCHAFGTAGTGGFGVKNASIGYYDSYYLQAVISVFMLLFGINFNIYYFLLIRKFSAAFKNAELRTYLGIILCSTLVIGWNIIPSFPSVGDALHHAFFTVNSIITTTGYSTTNFDTWPELSRLILLLLMIIGACAGSTGGGVKVSRLVIVAKSTAHEVRRLLHPRRVKVLMLDGKPIPKETVMGIQGYFAVYVAVAAVSLMLISLENYDMVTSLSAVLATLNNIGPGLNLVGPVCNFSFFSPLSKIVLTLDMLFGRLELFPMLLLLLPSTWKKRG